MNDPTAAIREHVIARLVHSGVTPAAAVSVAPLVVLDVLKAMKANEKR